MTFIVISILVNEVFLGLAAADQRYIDPNVDLFNAITSLYGISNDAIDLQAAVLENKGPNVRASPDTISFGFVTLDFDPYLMSKVAPDTLDSSGYGITEFSKRANSKRKSHPGWKKRLFISEEESRTRIPNYKLRKYPYSNMVRLSSGCMGTLLTSSHLLTAAHCVHDGMNFIENVGMLKVETPDKIGYRLHYILKISVPLIWLKYQEFMDAERSAWDFAVLRLNQPVHGREKFMPFDIPHTLSLNNNINFFGFQLISLAFNFNCRVEKFV